MTSAPAESPAQEFPDESFPAATTIQPPQVEHIVELHTAEPDTVPWQADLTGLLEAGCLTGWFDWCGHRIVVRTITTREELLVARLTQQYEGGMGGMKAYATATSSLCVESIDGQPMPVPLGERPDPDWAWAQQRFNYAQRWYPPTIDAILDGYLQLETRQREVLAGLGKASAPGGPAIPGSSGSSGSPSGGGS